MTELSEDNEHSPTSRHKPARNRLTALLVAALVAATAMVAFGVGTASAQTTDDDGVANQQQADGSTDGAADDDGADDSDDDGTCDREGAHREGAHRDGKHWRAGISDTVTEVLGIDAETLRDELKAGSTLADIAASQGVAVSDVVDALVAAISERAAEHDRDIDAGELTAKVTSFVNGEKPERLEGEDGRSGRRGRHLGGKIGWGGHAHTGTAGISASTTAA